MFLDAKLLLKCLYWCFFPRFEYSRRIIHRPKKFQEGCCGRFIKYSPLILSCQQYSGVTVLTSAGELELEIPSRKIQFHEAVHTERSYPHHKENAVCCKGIDKMAV